MSTDIKISGVPKFCAPHHHSPFFHSLLLSFPEQRPFSSDYIHRRQKMKALVK